MSEQELYEREGRGDELMRLCSCENHPDSTHDITTCDVCGFLRTIIISPIRETMPASMQSNPSQQHKPCIQNVPQSLRNEESNYKCFDPVLVSIGPYHHGKLEYQETEKLKYQSARQMYWTPNIGTAFSMVSELVPRARACYADDFRDHLDDFQFASMLFLDGSFILDFISRSIHDNHFDLIGNWFRSNSIRRDLFLLENQLPFLVLQVLMKMTHHQEEYWRTAMRSCIDNLITHSAGRDPNMAPSFPFDLQHEQQNQPIHLLDILRTALFSSSTDSPVNIHHHRNISWSSSFRYVKELKREGVAFKKISGTYGFGDIKFKSGFIFGEFFLPQIAIRDSSKSMFLNLVAYEACPDASLDYAAISYFCLMNELINDAKDVKELRSKDIILNYLRSDDQVVHLFNEIPKHLVADPDIYFSLKKSIEKHFENRLGLALVNIYNTNFAPWPTLRAVAAVAAAFALILTFLQTYYTMHPPV